MQSVASKDSYLTCVEWDVILCSLAPSVTLFGTYYIPACYCRLKTAEEKWQKYTQGPCQCRKLSQSRGDNRSKIHVHFCIGIPQSEYLLILYSPVIFTENIRLSSIILANNMNKYSELGCLLRKCTWFLLLLFLLDCDNFPCYLIGQ